jgi:hypothetical protein
MVTLAAFPGSLSSSAPSTICRQTEGATLTWPWHDGHKGSIWGPLRMSGLPQWGQEVVTLKM